MRYWIAINNEIAGPHTLEEIAVFLRSGKLPRNALLAEEGTEHWVPLSQRISLQDTVPSATPSISLRGSPVPAVAPPRSGSTSLIIASACLVAVGIAAFVMRDSLSAAFGGAPPPAAEGSTLERVSEEEIRSEELEAHLAAIEKVGGTVTRSPLGVNVSSVQLARGFSGNLAKLKSLEVLDLGANASDAIMADLAALPRLRELTIGFEIDRKPPGKPASRAPTADGLVMMPPTIVSYAAGKPPEGLTEDGMSHIGNISSLEDLALNAPVTDRGLEHLKKLRNLTSLWVISAEISDAGLAHLVGLPSLRQLDLSASGWVPRPWGPPKRKRSPISDAGLAHLAKLTGLEELRLGNTQVTDAGVESFREAMPDCEIEVRTR